VRRDRCPRCGVGVLLWGRNRPRPHRVYDIYTCGTYYDTKGQVVTHEGEHCTPVRRGEDMKVEVDIQLLRDVLHALDTEAEERGPVGEGTVQAVIDIIEEAEQRARMERVERVEEALNRIKAISYRFHVTHEDQEKSLRQVLKIVTDVIPPSGTYCAYCGEKFPIDGTDSVDAVRKHILSCEKHPIHELQEKVKWLEDFSGRAVFAIRYLLSHYVSPQDKNMAVVTARSLLERYKEKNRGAG